MIYSFKGYTPVVDPSSFVHPMAVVTGNVVIGKKVYIGPGAVLRGDWGSIVIHDGCNVQENCTIHMFPGCEAVLEQDAHIGHGAIIHGAHIGQNVLVGMNAVVMDGAVIEKECIIGALSFVKAKMLVAKRSLMAGNPAKKIRDVSDDMLEWKHKGTLLYQTLPEACKHDLREAAALTSVPPKRPRQDKFLKTWEDIKNSK